MFDIFDKYTVGTSSIYLNFEDLNDIEFNELREFGFVLVVDQSSLEIKNNKDSLARVLFEEVRLEVYEALDSRFMDDEDAIEEIRDVYLKDENRLISDVKNDLLMDWQPTDKELEQVQEIQREKLQEQRHPDDKGFGWDINSHNA